MGTNGYFTFQRYTGAVPFPFDSTTNELLVAPFFVDIDIRQVGQISYEVHNSTISETILSRVDLLINRSMSTEFHGQWLLVAKWDDVPEYGGNSSIVSNLLSLSSYSLSLFFFFFIFYYSYCSCRQIHSKEY